MPGWTRYRRVLPSNERQSEGPRTDVMKTSTRISQAGWAIVISVAISGVLGLAGCGSSSDSASAVQARKKANHGPVQVDPASRAPTDMVAAVSKGKAGPPVEMKYELREPPQADQPLDVDVALLPDVPGINRIAGSFQGGEGFQIVDGGNLTPVEKPVPGTPIRHLLRLLPKRDGIFTVSATVSVDTADDSITRTFSIPVIVGAGLPEETAKTQVAEEQSAAGTGSKTH